MPRLPWPTAAAAASGSLDVGRRKLETVRKKEGA